MFHKKICIAFLFPSYCTPLQHFIISIHFSFFTIILFSDDDLETGIGKYQWTLCCPPWKIYQGEKLLNRLLLLSSYNTGCYVRGLRTSFSYSVSASVCSFSSFFTEYVCYVEQTGLSHNNYGSDIIHLLGSIY